MLVRLVESNGAHNWVKISAALRSRTPKQCRERWHQNLKPSLNHTPISPEEGEIIERLVSAMGKRWAEIARQLPNRSDNAVKNWWNGGMNRRRRLVVRRDGSGREPQALGQGMESSSYFHQSHLAGNPKSLYVIPNRHGFDQPLVSPVQSDVSTADSTGDAPSLVSDHGSHRSNISPNQYMTGQRQPPRDERALSDTWDRGCGFYVSENAHPVPDSSHQNWQMYQDTPKYTRDAYQHTGLDQLANASCRHGSMPLGRILPTQQRLPTHLPGTSARPAAAPALVPGNVNQRQFDRSTSMQPSAIPSTSDPSRYQHVARDAINRRPAVSFVNQVPTSAQTRLNQPDFTTTIPSQITESPGETMSSASDPSGTVVGPASTTSTSKMSVASIITTSPPGQAQQ